MVKVPSLVEMLQAGMHFGHRVSKWHPKMKSYIFGQRNGVHIIDLEQTTKRLEEVSAHITRVISTGGVILFVGTKPQAKGSIEEHAKRCGMPYIHQRWLGGLLTNFSIVIRLSKKLRELKKQQSDGFLAKYTKKEQLVFQREIDRLQDLVGGIEYLEKLPDALFIADVKQDKTAVVEANKKSIPMIAVCDTNINPDYIEHIIPANDDAVQSIEMVVALMADAVLEGKALYEKNKIDATRKNEK